MHPPGSDVVLVRHGEIGVKSNQVRRKMETRLAGNVNSLLADRDVDGDVDRHRNRIFVHTDRPRSGDCDRDGRLRRRLGQPCGDGRTGAGSHVGRAPRRN